MQYSTADPMETGSPLVAIYTHVCMKLFQPRIYAGAIHSAGQYPWTESGPGGGDVSAFEKDLTIIIIKKTMKMT